MESPINIRQAALTDADQLAVLFNDYRLFYRKEPDIVGAKKFLEDRLMHGESVIYVAEKQQDLIGFAQLYPLFSSIRMQKLWLLNDLFVSPEYRGKGISKQLIQRCFQNAKESSACGVMLETERANAIGNALYLKMGFKLVENNFYFFET